MAEIEKLRQAKICMDKLAEGIDPTSGTVLPNDTLLNNINFSRCFFFVSDILGQVIENNGYIAGRSRNNAMLPPFALPDNMRDKIDITSSPAMIRSFTARINGLVDDSVMQRLKVTAFTTWLVNNGFLYEETINDKKRKKPTKTGEELGIYSEARDGQFGSYVAVLYKESAQRYLVSNLDQIIEISNGGMISA